MFHDGPEIGLTISWNELCSMVNSSLSAFSYSLIWSSQIAETNLVTITGTLALGALSGNEPRKKMDLPTALKKKNLVLSLPW